MNPTQFESPYGIKIKAAQELPEEKRLPILKSNRRSIASNSERPTSNLSQQRVFHKQATARKPSGVIQFESLNNIDIGL